MRARHADQRVATSRRRAAALGLRLAKVGDGYVLSDERGPISEGLPDKAAVAETLDEVGARWYLHHSDDLLPCIRPLDVRWNGSGQRYILVDVWCPFCAGVHTHTGPMFDRRRSHCADVKVRGSYLILDLDCLLPRLKVAS